MLIGVPKEIHPGENRVALIPAGIQLLQKAGFEVVVQAGATLVCLLDAWFNLPTVKLLAERNIRSFALEFIPRSTRAQSMDVLSSMGAINGYRAVLSGAMELPQYFPMLMTAAGTIHPAKVFVIGAGVAGLMAISTARRMGAVVEAYDTRVEVREQVE